MDIPATVTTHPFMLQRGDIRTLRATRGMVLICVEGHVQRTELVSRIDDPWPYAVQVALAQGEAYLCEQGGPLRLAAQSEVRLLCLRPLPWWRVLVWRLQRIGTKYAMITDIRRGVEQSGSSSGS